MTSPSMARPGDRSPLDGVLADLAGLLEHAEQLARGLAGVGVRQHILDELLTLTEALDHLRCERCEDGTGTVLRRSGRVCGACDAALAVCEADRNDVIDAEAIYHRTTAYHPSCYGGGQ